MDEELVKRITQLVLQEVMKYKQENSRQTKAPIGESKLLKNIGRAGHGSSIMEIVIGLGPAFSITINKTINGLSHRDVLKELMAGIEEQGMVPRLVRVTKTSDVCFIGKEAAMLSGSGIGIGLQSKGTAVIHQKDLYPLSNLELFPQAPLLTLEHYRKIGANAAMYAKGIMVKPIECENDSTVRAKYQVKAALMHIKETDGVIKDGEDMEVSMDLL
jgi:glycerol dehydratase medium subunit/propanediol dehydratase medium subunit